MSSLWDVPAEPTSDMQKLAIVVVLLLPALALVVIVLRIMGRVAARQFGLDDWFISFAMFLSIIETAASYFFIKTNFIGIQPEDIPTTTDPPTPALIWSYTVQLLYNPILALVKASFLIFLRRLFGRQKTGVRRLIDALQAVNAAQAVAVLAAVAFQCTPVALAWGDTTLDGGRCVDRRVLFTATAALNMATDLAVLALPAWIFSGLRIPRRVKAALLVVFLLGFLVTVASAARLVLLVRGLFGGGRRGTGFGFVTMAVETNLAIITASAPALRPFFRAWSRGGWMPALSSVVVDRGMGERDEEEAGTGVVGGRRGGGGYTGEGRRGGSRRGRGAVRVGDIRVVGGRRVEDKEVDVVLGSDGGSSEEEAEERENKRGLRVSDVQREVDGLVREMGEGLGREEGYKKKKSGRSLTYDYRESEGQAERERRRDAEKYQEYLRRAAVDPEEVSGFYAAGVVVSEGEREMERTKTSQREVTRRSRDYSQERRSRYGDKRYGVITPIEPPPTRAF